MILRGTRHTSPGFTLLEILLVTIILSILISMVTVQFRRTFDNLQFKNFVLDLFTTLRYAHDKAILEKGTYLVRYTPNPPGYRLEQSTGMKVDGHVEYRRIKDRTGIFHPLPKNTQTQIDPQQIIFYPDGGATEARWVFTDFKGHETTLRVHPEVGEATMDESHG